MSDLNWFRLLFSISTAAWIVAGVWFGSVYLSRWLKDGRRAIFIASNIWIALSNLSEALMYFLIVWFFVDSALAARIALYYIPAGLTLRAVAFATTAWWVMYRTREHKLTK